MYSNTAKGQLWIVSERLFEMMTCLDGDVLDAWCSWSVSTCCDSGLSCSIYSCSRAAVRVLQRHMTLPFHFLVEQENFCITSTEQNIVTSETSVRDKCHKCNIYCHIAVHALVPSPPPSHTRHLLTLSPSSAKMDCWQGLVRTWSTHIILPATLIPNYVLLKYSNPMHLSLCNIYSCLWCSSAICCVNSVIAIQY